MLDLSDMMARVKPDALEQALIRLGWSMEDLKIQAGQSRIFMRDMNKGLPLAAVKAEEIADAVGLDVEELFDLREKKVKAMLQEYADEARYLETQFERLKMLHENIGPGSQNLSGMPHANTNSISDKTGDLAIRITETEEEIADLQQAQTERRKEIMKLIRKVKKPDHRSVIQLRYLDGADWPDICRILYGKEKDYKRATQLYTDKTYKLHGAAIAEMEMLVEWDD